MITKLSHTSFFVSDQDKAYDFYINKLGFKVNTDVKMENGFLRSFFFLQMAQMVLMKM